MAGMINLAATAAGYACSSDLIQGAGGGWTQIVLADPQRWYLSIEVKFHAGNYVVISPEMFVVAGPAFLQSVSILIHKYRDAPALTTGPWWVFSEAAWAVQVTEERFQRG